MASLKKGQDVYREWHDKEPTKVTKAQEKKLNEEYACCIGIAEEILYSSKKWETKSFDYVHLFTSHPKVYLVESDVSEDEQIGRPVKVTSLTGSRNHQAALVTTLLGTVKELTCKDNQGEQFNVAVGRGAKLLSTPDKKTLIILTKSGPIFIRGGQMRVTSRGIVK